jgi:periplasmic copper chaperone A
MRGVKTLPRRLWLTLGCALCLAVSAVAQKPEIIGITIGDAWSRPTMEGMPMGVAYFTIMNGRDTEDALLSASTPVAGHVEMHETKFEDGMAKMRPLKEIRVPARGRVAVAPSGIHLMLVDLKSPLVAGTKVPMTLQFRNAGRIEIQLAVSSRTD